MDKQQVNKETGETEIVGIPSDGFGLPRASHFGTPTPKDFGLDEPTIDFVEDIYYPTRLDYIASKALQGLVSGQSEKDRRAAPKAAVKLAQELIESLDSA